MNRGTFIKLLIIRKKELEKQKEITHKVLIEAEKELQKEWDKWL